MRKARRAPHSENTKRLLSQRCRAFWTQEERQKQRERTIRKMKQRTEAREAQEAVA